ncbi:MAG: sulfotransferase [Pseudomonadota bacterium]
MSQKSPISFGSKRAKYLNRLVTTLASPFEAFLESRTNPKESAVCFIVGPPRSGTTLLYEMIVTRFQCGYFTNLAKRLFEVPVVATWICRNEMRRRSGSFDSVYGELDGNAAPSEAGRIWRFWMPYAAPYSFDLPGVSPKRIHRKIAAICRLAGGPMIVKNPILQSDIPAITEMFPEAVFLHIERDWADNARSLMGLRAKRTPEDDTGWVSLRPSGWETYASADALTQSCVQVMLSHKDIETYLEGPRRAGRLMKIRYDILCEKPDTVLDEIEAFLAANNIAITRKPFSQKGLNIEPRKPPTDDTQTKIQACLEDLSGRTQA